MDKENEKEHNEQSQLDEAQQECERCGKEAILTPMLCSDEETYMYCKECANIAEAYADMEYERQREEYDPDDPDHERSNKPLEEEGI